jgi:rod shape-determining protein MreB and related proteins
VYGQGDGGRPVPGRARAPARGVEPVVATGRCCLSWAVLRGTTVRDGTVERPARLRRWNVAVDLGTASIRVAVRRRGTVYDQPAVIALDRRATTVVAAGTAAKSMIGRTPPHLEVLAPFRLGGFDDSTAAHHLLARALAEGRRRLRVGRPRVLLGLSRSVPVIEASAMARLAARVGAADVHLVDGLALTALGAAPMRSRARRMVVANLGARTSEVAYVARDGIIASAHVPVGGDHVDGAIVRYVRDRHGIDIGDLAAERVKLVLASVAGPPDAAVRVRGWDAATQEPRFAQVTADELDGVVASYTDRVVTVIQTLIDEQRDIPEEVLQRGIVLAGGSAHLAGVADAVRERLELPAVVTDHPARTAIEGAHECLLVAGEALLLGPVGGLLLSSNERMHRIEAQFPHMPPYEAESQRSSI